MAVQKSQYLVSQKTLFTITPGEAISNGIIMSLLCSFMLQLTYSSYRYIFDFQVFFFLFLNFSLTKFRQDFSQQTEISGDI